MLRRLFEVVASVLFDVSSFDLLPAIQEYRATAKVNISRCEVVEALVVTPVIVVVDEHRDGPFQITWEIIIFQKYPAFQ